jgi:serine/threonine-protein kinase
MRLSAGDRLGPYQILSPIGAGGMGEVYKARDTRLDRTVAIKVSKEKFSERFEREARSIAALNHPHICQLYDVAPDYLVMEYVEGSPLKGPLAVEKAVEYAGQILSALDAAHRKGITHRNLKPANILVTKLGIKLLDFGLARIAASDQDATLTMAGKVMGTPAYMAPEQWEGKPCDTRADIYCFGCVLYEMLTGKRAAQEGRQPVKSPPLEGIIVTCMKQDPEERWQSARDISEMMTLPTPPAPKARPRWPWIAAAGVLAVVAIVLGTALWRSAPRVIEQPVVRLDLDLGPDVPLGSTSGPAVIVSPDGTRLVFVSQGPDRVPHLFTRLLGQPKATLLAKTEGAYAPFFSPDGQWVGFFAQGKLKKTRIDGGEPISLCDAPAGRGASWGEDGNIIAALDTQTVLSEVPSEGGKAVSVTDFSLGENSHRWPQVLPGGKGVLFNASIAVGNFDEAGIAVVSVKDHRRRL